MLQTLVMNWWLLALCAVLEALVSAIYLVMQGEAEPLTFHAWRNTILILGELTIAAGACTVAAATWTSAKRRCWLLVPNGAALIALGVIYVYFVRYRISFRTIALLIILMAVSIGILEFLSARSLGWVLALAGAASIGFALVFVALGFRWVRIAPGSHPDLLWLGLYFGFSAICMLAAALTLRGGVTRDAYGTA